MKNIKDVISKVIGDVGSHIGNSNSCQSYPFKEKSRGY